jgi:hypothetical protein
MLEIHDRAAELTSAPVKREGRSRKAAAGYVLQLLGDIVFSLCNLDFHSLAHVMFMSQ